MFSRTLLAIFVFAAISAQASCIHGTSFLRREVSEEGKVKVSNFGYSGTRGPSNWAQLETGNARCATGKNQSPIVLDDKIKKAASKPKVVIADVEEAEFENLGTTLETIVNGTTTFEGKDFELKQFHLHTPSEHRINEEYFPVEMHMVHEAADGSIAVVAIPFQLTEDGSTTKLLTSVIENIDDVKAPGTVTKTGKLEFAELVNAIQTEPLFQYTGSLTTPPCAEGLTFLVMEKPMALDVKTFNSLKSVIKFNARIVQNSLGETNVLEIAALDAAVKAAIDGTAAVEGETNSTDTAAATSVTKSGAVTKTVTEIATETGKSESVSTAEDKNTEAAKKAEGSTADDTKVILLSNKLWRRRRAYKQL